MKPISYNSLSLVLENWDKARYSDEKFSEKFAMNSLDKMFQLKPEAKTVFGYSPEDEVSSVQSAMHGRLFSQVFDSIFQMLGPDIEFVEEVLEQVGKRHVKMGISPSFFSYMGKALLFAVEEALKRPLTEDETAAWIEVYDSISSEMIRVMRVHGAK